MLTSGARTRAVHTPATIRARAATDPAAMSAIFFAPASAGAAFPQGGYPDPPRPRPHPGQGLPPGPDRPSGPRFSFPAWGLLSFLCTGQHSLSPILSSCVVSYSPPVSPAGRLSTALGSGGVCPTGLLIRQGGLRRQLRLGPGSLVRCGAAGAGVRPPDR